MDELYSLIAVGKKERLCLSVEQWPLLPRPPYYKHYNMRYQKGYFRVKSSKNPKRLKTEFYVRPSRKQRELAN